MRQITAFLMATTLAALLAGCTQFPQLDAAVSDAARAADYPSLVPAQTLTDRRKGERLRPTDGPALLSRADRLRQRGAALRNRRGGGAGAQLARAERLRERAGILRSLPVVDEAARLRFSQTLERLGG